MDERVTVSVKNLCNRRSYYKNRSSVLLKQKQWYNQNRDAILLQQKMYKSGVRLPLAECRRMLAVPKQEACNV
jgi:hypothetical protein